MNCITICPTLIHILIHIISTSRICDSCTMLGLVICISQFHRTCCFTIEMCRSQIIWMVRVIISLRNVRNSFPIHLWYKNCPILNSCKIFFHILLMILDFCGFFLIVQSFSCLILCSTFYFQSTYWATELFVILREVTNKLFQSKVCD